MLQKKDRTLQAFGKIFAANLMDCCYCNYIVSPISAAGVGVQTAEPRKKQGSRVSTSQSWHVGGETSKKRL